MSAAPKFAANPLRRAMIAKVKVAQKQTGMAEDDYRALLARVTGKCSAADCSEAQLDAVLAEFTRLGFRASAPRRPRTGSAPADHPMARKARAMWISLYNLGEVRDASEHALEAFARRQLGVDRLQWADQGKAYKMIEALKAMAERAGWSQESTRFSDAPVSSDVLLQRLIRRQAEILRDAGQGRWPDEIVQMYLPVPAKRWTLLPTYRLRQVATAMGAAVRAVKAG